MGRNRHDGVGEDPARWRRMWRLDPRIVFLNHGSFGAVPVAVQAEQDRLRAEMEANPVAFLARELGERLEAARAVLAAFIGAEDEGLVFVANATSGIATVLESLDLARGDELLTTDHAYPACRRALERVASRHGARVVVAEVPFPLASETAVVDALVRRVGARTRLALVDHVTSPTALVLPVERIVAELGDRDVPVLVDGAHAPGMLDLHVAATGAAAYTGNCHKWMCAPRGAGFLWLREDWRDRVRPLVTSLGAAGAWASRSLLHAEFDWCGTFDPTAWLSVPGAIRFMGSLLPGGWEELRRDNHRLIVRAREELCRALNLEPPCPESMLASMASVPLPDGDDEVQARLLAEHRIEVPVIAWPGPPRRLLRVSAQLYNHLEEYRRLAVALRGVL